MDLLTFSRAGILSVLGLALCLWIPDSASTYRPGQRTPTVTPETTSRSAPDSRRRPPPFTPGIRIRPPRFVPGIEMIPGPRGPSGPPIEYFDQDDEGPPRVRQPRKQIQQKVKKSETVKLAKPRVPYLQELAMDMDPSLVELVALDPVKALRVYEKALKQARRTGKPKSEWKASTDLGHVYYLTGRFTRAADRYWRAAEISRRERDPMGEGIALRNAGATLIAAGDHDRAEEPNLHALDRFTSQGRNLDARMTLNNLGVLEKNRGKYRGAASYLEQALARARDSDRVRMLVQHNLGILHMRWGEYDRAVDDFSAYGATASSLGRQAEAAQAFLDAASVYSRQGSYDRAVIRVREAIRIQTAAKIDTDWSKKLMGDLLVEMGRTEEAKEFVTESGYDSSAGLLNLVTSQPQRAKKHYERLLDAAGKEQNLDEMFTAHTGLGKAYESLKDYGRAERHYTKAVDITEDIRASLLFSERRNFFAEKVNGFARSEPAKGLARVAFKQKNPSKAVYAGEVTKARGFSDNLSQKTDGSHFGVPQELLQKEELLTNRLAALKTSLHAVPKAADRQRFQDMLHDIQQEDGQRKAFVRDLCERCKDYCSVKYPEPVAIPDAAIKADEYVLVFEVLGDAVGMTLLHGKQVVRFALPSWQADDLEKQVRRLRNPFEQVQLTKFSPELAGKLYERLLADALASVPAGSSITIVPDGPLALLPFESLVKSGKPAWVSGPQGDYPSGLTYVGDLYSIAYYQSLTAMTLVRTLDKGRRTGNRVLVMADPVFEVADERFRSTDTRIAQPQHRPELPADGQAPGTALLGTMSLRRLPESEKLGKSLKELLGADCQMYTGMACTKQTFLQAFGRDAAPYAAVVFGTHGFAANDLPGIMEPVLALTMVPRGTDGLLTMSEVAGLNMKVDMAALTACKTGLGMRLPGEGVLSMGRAFQAAGARSVIMSLWSVAEEPSIALMDEFFKERVRGRDKRAAWAAARAHIRKRGFEHPFFWASFILVGESQ